MGSCESNPSKNPISVLPDEFISGKGIVKKEELVETGLIAFYFSAHWCPPCRAFTPKLANFYKKVNENGNKLQIIFVSSDKDIQSFNEYFATMPWVAVPFTSPKREELANIFGISGIPSLIVCNKEGKVVDSNGRSTVESQGVGALEKWTK